MNSSKHTLVATTNLAYVITLNSTWNTLLLKEPALYDIAQFAIFALAGLGGVLVSPNVTHD
jgi:hypothetical protein